MWSINRPSNSQQDECAIVGGRLALILQRIFFFQVIVGVAMVGMGGFIVPSLPYVMLDAVLTPAELQNDEKVSKTLSLLQRQVPLYMTTWIAAGVFLVGTSFAGRRMIRTLFNAC